MKWTTGDERFQGKCQELLSAEVPIKIEMMQILFQINLISSGGVQMIQPEKIKTAENINKKTCSDSRIASCRTFPLDLIKAWGYEECARNTCGCEKPPKKVWNCLTFREVYCLSIDAESKWLESAVKAFNDAFSLRFDVSQTGSWLFNLCMQNPV